MALPTFTVAPVRAAQLQALRDRTRMVRKTADETINSSTTLQDDNQLFLTVEPQTEYDLVVQLIVNSPAAADFKWTFTEPAATIIRFGYVIPNLDDLGHTATVATLVTDGTDQVLRLTGTVVTDASGGTLQLQWAQNTSDAGSTTVKAHSFMRLIQQT